MRNIVTYDETWVHDYGSKAKRQSSKWSEPTFPQPKKTQQQCSHVKVKLLVFFVLCGFVYFEYVPKNQNY